MKYNYKTRETCSSKIIVELDGDILKSVQFMGGCNGNLKGIAAIVQGMKTDEVIARFKGIRCGTKTTSCPDQLVCAIKEAKAVAK